MEPNFEALKVVSDTYDSTKLGLLNTLVEAIYSGSPQQRAFANQLLSEIKDDRDAWKRCEDILMSSETSLNTKFFALSIYDSATSSRWTELPREKIINTVLELIKSVASRGPRTEEKPLLRKLDKVFVNAVKNEWLLGSEMWKGIIPQLASLAGNDQNMWENTMVMLNMLSEDIFDFGTNTMTSRKVVLLRQTLSEQFIHVQKLVELVLSQYVQSPPNTVKNSLVNASLLTMSHYLKWIPRETLFQSNFIEVIITHFYTPLVFRIESVKCLSEVFSVSVDPTNRVQDIPNQAMHQQKMSHWVALISEHLAQVPRSILIEGKSPAANERLFYETFINQLSIMVHSLVKHNSYVLFAGASGGSSPSLNLLSVCIRLTAIASEEGFKSFVQMWQQFTEYLAVAVRRLRQQPGISTPNHSVELDILETYGVNANSGVSVSTENTTPISSATISLLLPLLSELAKTLILRMAQPPEVTISETDDGEIVRADQKETAEIDLYNGMAKCLQNITFVDRGLIEPTLLGMLKELSSSVSRSGGGSAGTAVTEWNTVLLSKLIWSAGSIAGVTPSVESEGEEKRFTFEMIRELLGLCNLHNNKTNRAIVASAVLFYCARHHRFLRANHKFLRTVFKKLFEFMNESTPGVREMACDTFLIISRSCAHKLVEQVSENGTTFAPFVDSLAGEIHQFMVPLEALQKCTVYEAVGIMIGAVTANVPRQEHLVTVFLQPYTEKWVQILATANENPNVLFALNVLRELSLFLRLFERMTFGIKSSLAVQQLLSQIYENILRLYKVYSETIAKSVVQQHVSVHVEAIKLMRRVKSDCLRLVGTFVAVPVGNNSPNTIAASIIPQLLEYVLSDYKNSAPQTRDHEVLLLLSSLCSNLSSSVNPALRGIFDTVVYPSRDMLLRDSEGANSGRSYPDHRLAFYELIKNMTSHCFSGLVDVLFQSDQLGPFLEMLVDGIRNESPQIADLSLDCLNEFLNAITNAAKSNLVNPETTVVIYTTVFAPLVDVILTALTDKLHDSGKELQIRILLHLLLVASNGYLQIPVEHAKAMVAVAVTRVAPTIILPQRDALVKGMFDNANNPEIFKQLVNDLKITTASGGTSLDL